MTLKRWSNRDAAADRGAFAVMYAVLTVVLVGVTSIVIDLAALRLDRRVDRAAADAAAIAGAGQLGEDGGNPVGACKRAIDYIASNLETDRPADNCAGLPASPAAVCDDTTPAGTVSQDIAGRTVIVTWPVPDGHELLTEPDIEAADEVGITLDETPSDGTRCQRIGVEVVHNRSFIFGGIFGGTGATTTSKSVGLARLHSTGDLPVPLVTLHGSTCDAIQAEDGEITVGEGSSFPGEVAVDSDARNCGSDPLLDVDASSQFTTERLGIFRLSHSASYPRVQAAYYSRGWRVTAQPWTDRYDCPSDPSNCGLKSSDTDGVDYLSQWKDYGDNPPVGPVPVPGHVVTQSPPWDHRSGANCVITTSGEIGQDVHFQDCDGDVVEIAPGVTVVIDGDLVSHHDLIINSGANVTFNGAVHIGGEEPDPDENLEIRDAILTVAGTLDVSGQLVIGDSAEVTIDKSMDPMVTVQTLTVNAGTLIVRDPIHVPGAIDLNSGGLADFEQPVLADAVFVSGDMRVSSTLDVQNAISVEPGGDFHAIGEVRAGGSMTVSPAAIVKVDAPLAVQGDLTVGGCLLIADSDVTHCTMRPDETAAPASPDGVNVYIGDDLTVSGSLVTRQSFLYVAGHLDASPAGLLSFIAPYDYADCPLAGPPTAGCFADLAVWADGVTRPGGSGQVHQLDLGNAPCSAPPPGIGQACVDGTIFVPRGDLEVRWSESVELNHAQFVAQRLIFDGSDSTSSTNELTIRPDPERTTLIPQSAGVLIR